MVIRTFWFHIGEEKNAENKKYCIKIINENEKRQTFAIIKKKE